MTFADKADPEFKFANAGDISVVIYDSATNGCWTNIKEAKTYASDKIEILGGTISDKIAASTRGLEFQIIASGSRSKITGRCDGSISIRVVRLSKSTAHPETFGLMVYSEIAWWLSDNVNFNNNVLDAIKEAIAEWEQ